MRGFKVPTFSIEFIFGTAMHNTIQDWLKVLFDVSTVEADNMDLEKNFMDNFREEYKVQFEKNNKQHFSTADNMGENFEDAKEILSYLKKHKNEIFPKKGFKLVGIELPIIYPIETQLGHKNLFINGFIDIIIYDEEHERYNIIDIKTARSGWSPKERKDPKKISQLLIYKEYFGRLFSINPDQIEVTYLILKKKVYDNPAFPGANKRISSFKPAAGKNKRSLLIKSFESFVNDCFLTDGTYNLDKEYPKTEDVKDCKYCPYFKDDTLCGGANKKKK